MAIKPNELITDSEKIKEQVNIAVARFDNILKKKSPDFNYYTASIDGVLSFEICKEIVKEYINVGWAFARCVPSESEQFTELCLWMIKDVHTEHCSIYSCKYGEEDFCTVYQRRVPPTSNNWDDEY
jgi:hypothetical protein